MKRIWELRGKDNSVIDRILTGLRRLNRLLRWLDSSQFFVKSGFHQTKVQEGDI